MRITSRKGSRLYLVVLCALLVLTLPFSAVAEKGVILVDEDGSVGYEAAPGFPDTERELEKLAPDFGELATPAPTPAPTPVPRPGLRAVATPVPPAYPGSLIKYGQKNASVTLIQNRLKELGYFSGTATGNFLEVTLACVKTFQARNGLASDGIVGQLTWAKLFFDPDVISAGQSTPPPTSNATYRITVDVVNQIVTVYGKDAQGQHTRVVKRMICSTGTPSYPTPISVYTLNGRTARWCYFPEWGSHAQYWTRINSSIAFHSVIYTKAAENALVLSSYTALGTQASHGCIRLLVADAKWIYDNCGAGTIVETFKGKSDPEGTQALKPGPIDSKTYLPKVTPQPTAPSVYNSNQLPPQPFRTLKVGITGADVFWLQSRLAQVGLYSGSITGGYYEGTRDAVKVFQKANGLTVDGMAGVKTQTALYAYILNAPKMLTLTLDPTAVPEEIPSATPTVAPPTPTPEPAPTAAPHPDATSEESSPPFGDAEPTQTPRSAT